MKQNNALIQNHRVKNGDTIKEKMVAPPDLNRGPTDYESGALTN